jgi:methyl-accepting chemotaxis protein
MATTKIAVRRKEAGRALARFTWRRVFIRVVALAGCLVAIVGMYASVRAYREIARAETVAQEQLRETSATFRQVAGSLRTVSDSAEHAATTTDDANDTLGEAATTTRNAAGTLDETAGAINFTIPFTNTKPLEGVDTSFRDTATELRTLADSLDQTGGSLELNGNDLRAISRDVDTMALQMDEVSDQLRQFAGDGPGESGLMQITGGARLIISWSVVLHLLLLAMAICLYLLTTKGLDGRPERAGD